MKQFDLISFLNKFYGITNASLNNEHLTHSTIQILFPDIRTCPINEVSNEDLYKGNIIGVYDKNNIIVYYYNPHLEINFDNIINEDEKNEISVNINDIENLSKNELLKLRRKLRIEGLVSEAKKLTRLIRKRKKEEPIIYRQDKEKLKIKESYYD